jgi:hypothetical protein
MLQGHWDWELLATNLHCPTAGVLGTEYSGMTLISAFVKVTSMEASDQPAHKSLMTEMTYSNS